MQVPQKTLGMLRQAELAVSSRSLRPINKQTMKYAVKSAMTEVSVGTRGRDL